jgi:hypothetical protein
VDKSKPNEPAPAFVGYAGLLPDHIQISETPLPSGVPDAETAIELDDLRKARQIANLPATAKAEFHKERHFHTLEDQVAETKGRVTELKADFEQRLQELKTDYEKRLQELTDKLTTLNNTYMRVLPKYETLKQIVRANRWNTCFATILTLIGGATISAAGRSDGLMALGWALLLAGCGWIVVQHVLSVRVDD